VRLSSERLAVEVAEPGAIYRGSRFDWTGTVTQVTLDGQHTFCGAEPPGGTGGVGLHNEFGLFVAIGYDEAAPGKPFPKLGVGLLTRPDDGPYQFARPHEIAPFPIIVSATGSAAEFTVEPRECRGYAARLVKRLAVERDTLRIGYALENVGTRPLETHEYVHNFLSLDGLPVGAGYRLAVPTASRDWLTPPLRADGGEITWAQTPQEAFYGRTSAFAAADSCWVLTGGGLRVRECTDRPWMAFALWGTDSVVSPEAFVAVRVPPGETSSWQRTYTFSADFPERRNL
jgi:hypothetical protein